MARRSYKVNGLNLILVAFSLFVVAGVAIFLSSNQPVQTNSDASYSTKTATGKLVKKGSKDFAPCLKANAAYKYGLIPVGREIYTCTPLVVNAKLADPLVGKAVISTGTLQKGIFYAVSIKETKSSPKPTFTPTPTSTCVPLPDCPVSNTVGGDGYLHCPSAEELPGVNYCRVKSASPPKY